MDRQASRIIDRRRFSVDVENARLEILRLRAQIETDRIQLDDLALDAVTVAVTDQLHREPCEEAASRGLDIFLEKPIATTLEDAEAIIEAADRASVKLMVCHTLRYWKE